jgi:hypothetical protein
LLELSELELTNCVSSEGGDGAPTIAGTGTKRADGSFSIMNKLTSEICVISDNDRAKQPGHDILNE